MNAVLSLMANSWQILLGAVFLLAIRMVKSRKHKVLIHYEGPGDIGVACVRHPDPDANPIKEALMVEGVNPKNATEIDDECIKRGILYGSNMRMLSCLLRKHRYVKIRVFGGNLDSVSRIMHTSCFASGILLSFILDGNLEVI